jgi:hypothetical protein
LCENCKIGTSAAKQAAEKVFILSFRAKRGISLRLNCKKKKEGEIPRFARDEKLLSFSAACKAAPVCRTDVVAEATTHKDSEVLTQTLKTIPLKAYYFELGIQARMCTVIAHYCRPFDSGEE